MSVTDHEHNQLLRSYERMVDAVSRGQAEIQSSAADLTRLRAEVERLREALEKIVAWRDVVAATPKLHYLAVAMDTARRIALQQQETDPNG